MNEDLFEGGRSLTPRGTTAAQARQAESYTPVSFLLNSDSGSAIQETAALPLYGCSDNRLNMLLGTTENLSRTMFAVFLVGEGLSLDLRYLAAHAGRGTNPNMRVEG